MKLFNLKNILAFCLILSVTSVHSARVANDNYIKINDVLSFFDFEDLRSYVWENGDRKTYCPNYQNNPHYVLDDDTEIYFNPTSDEDTLSDSDYNVMYIVTKWNGKPFNFYLYMAKDANVYLFDYKNNITSEELKADALNRLREIIANFKKVL